MGDVVYLGEDGIRTESGPEEPVPSVVAYLEELLALAKEGKVSGVVCITASNGYSPGYAILGHIGGYSTIGAMSCAKEHLTRSQIDAFEMDDG